MTPSAPPAGPEVSLAPPLREAWSLSYGHVVWDLPLVAEGLLYLTWKKKLIAQDERTQKKAWTLPCEGAPKALWQDKVVAWTGRDEGVLVEARTGKIDGRIQGLSPLDVAVVEDVLVATAVDNGPLVYAVDLSGGKPLWEARPGSGDNSVSSVFAAGPDALFLGLRDGTVQALDRRTGRETWTHSVADLTWNHPSDGAVPEATTGPLALHGDLVVCRLNGHHVVALRAQDGRRAWTFKAPARTAGGCLYDGRYYVTDWARGYHVLDAATGKVVAKADLRKGLPARVASVSNHFPLLVSETHLFTGSADGYVLAFARETGEYAWSHRPKGGGTFQARSSCMSANGRFYYADMSGRLYCLEETKPSGRA